ncbi:DUF2062 domain-containing protein [Sphingosinicella rhizophila]|uniref:DUF2062 domain-containing protein n=1 Tax=Sphingosinicella rhizophila TaxID=3050082 RepID=A0ABU3Q2Q9_9SPHN|nr:DUF2062 domain-containing protein [Sphingosinicella sp. GR2756]MDT9597706.1 DUF2062 domain-containing protein [Sphingosinicella sp. GR2756]
MSAGGRKDWLARWIGKNMPKREDLAESRWIRPLGHRVLHSEFWRFTRRSVPRGVGVGLIVGIFLMIPGIQIVGAAFLSIPFRANIPVAALMTFLSNPVTTPFILLASLQVGVVLGFRADLAAFHEMRASGATAANWLAWLFSDAAPALVSGLFIIAVVTGALGYFISIWVWRWWIARKWRRRRARRSEI